MKRFLVALAALTIFGGLLLLIHHLNITGSFGVVYRLPFGL